MASKNTIPITVVIATASRDGGHLAPYLESTLQSVMAQTLPPAEIIVVEDGKPAGPGFVEPWIRSLTASPSALRYQCYHPAHGAPAAPRNLAIREATQPWIAFLDHDDLWDPQKLEQQWAAITADPNLTMVHGNARFIGPHVHEARSLSEIHQVLSGTASVEGVLNSYTIMSSVVIRRDFLLATGLLDEKASPCDDTDLFLRLGEQGVKIGFVPQICVSYRVLPHSLSADALRVNRMKLVILEKHALGNAAEAQRRKLAFALFNSGYPDEALQHFQALQSPNFKIWFYRTALAHRKPQWIYAARKLLALARGHLV